MSVKAFVIDDTVTYRKIVSEILSSIPEIDSVGTAPTGSIGLKKISQCNPDLIFLDAHMPEMDGVETLKKILAQSPSVNVVMISSISSRNTKDTIEALQSGAIDFISKPVGDDPVQNKQLLKNDILRVIRLVELRKNTKSIPHTKSIDKQANPVLQPPKLTISLTKPLFPFTICVIGVSTGGPEALNKLIPLLPANFPIPILLVQHMPPLFTNSLAESLGRKSKLRVIEAPENEVIKPGTVYIAPGGKHMVLRSKDDVNIIGHNDLPPENSCRPSVDVLFRSVASVYENQGILAIILTGMGNDGCNGVRTLKRGKCYCITQSESSCVVYGMPRAVDDAGLSDLSLSIEDIATEMIHLTRI